MLGAQAGPPLGVGLCLPLWGWNQALFSSYVCSRVLAPGPASFLDKQRVQEVVIACLTDSILRGRL